MGLLQNNYRDSMAVHKFFGATTSNGSLPSGGDVNFHRTGATRNLTAGTGVTNQQAGYPYGHRHPQTWSMPQKAGALSTYQNINGSSAVAASALAVKLATADLSGLGTLEAIGGLVVQLIADLAGSGEISDADLKAFLQAAASIGGSGEISDADLEGFGAMLAGLLGDGTLDDSTVTAIGELEAALTVTGAGLNTANVAQAVWSALASANNVTGTMGEKLNDAGSASNPWTEIIESGLTAAEILRIVASALAGEVSGAGTGTETFVGLDGTTHRIVSTVDDNGNRTAVVVDGS